MYADRTSFDAAVRLSVMTTFANQVAQDELENNPDVHSITISVTKQSDGFFAAELFLLAQNGMQIGGQSL